MTGRGGQWSGPRDVYNMLAHWPRGLASRDMGLASRAGMTQLAGPRVKPNNCVLVAPIRGATQRVHRLHRPQSRLTWLEAAMAVTFLFQWGATFPHGPQKAPPERWTEIFRYFPFATNAALAAGSVVGPLGNARG